MINWVGLKSLFKFLILLLTRLINWQARMIEDGPSKRQKIVIASLWIGRRNWRFYFFIGINSLWDYSAHAWSVLNAVQRNIEFHFGKYIHIFWKGLCSPFSNLLATKRIGNTRQCKVPPWSSYWCAPDCLERLPGTLQDLVISLTWTLLFGQTLELWLLKYNWWNSFSSRDFRLMRRKKLCMTLIIAVQLS